MNLIIRKCNIKIYQLKSQSQRNLSLEKKIKKKKKKYRRFFEDNRVTISTLSEI